MKPSPKKVARIYRQGRTPVRKTRTAGEVRFIKDRGSNDAEWGWGSPGPSERNIIPDFLFNAKYLKPLAQSMRSALMALGHLTSAYNTFVKIKSRNISPDGNLGGQGYIQKIPDMRRQLMNCIEAMSAYTDTVYDELSAPHWNPSEDTLDPRDREEVKDIVEEAEEIKEDPEGWAEEQEDEEVSGKTASSMTPEDLLRTLDAIPGRVAFLENSYGELLVPGSDPDHIVDSLKRETQDLRYAALSVVRSVRNALPPSSSAVASKYSRSRNVV